MKYKLNFRSILKNPNVMPEKIYSVYSYPKKVDYYSYISGVHMRDTMETLKVTHISLHLLSRVFRAKTTLKNLLMNLIKHNKNRVDVLLLQVYTPNTHTQWVTFY